MIVVLGDEESQIDNSYLYLQPRMQSRSLHKRVVVGIKPVDERHSFPAKLGQDVFDGVRVVVSFVRLLIRHVGSGEWVAARFEIVKPAHAQRLEIEQMSGLLLNRPFVAIAPRQNFGGHGAHSIFQPCRRSAQALDYVRVHAKRQAKSELTLNPFGTFDHNLNCDAYRQATPLWAAASAMALPLRCAASL